MWMTRRPPRSSCVSALCRRWSDGRRRSRCVSQHALNAHSGTLILYAPCTAKSAMLPCERRKLLSSHSRSAAVSARATRCRISHRASCDDDDDDGGGGSSPQRERESAIDLLERSWWWPTGAKGPCTSPHKDCWLLVWVRIERRKK